MLLHALLEIDTTLISTVLSLGMSRNVVPCLHNVAVFDISLSGYALLNASRTAANDFDAK